MAGQGLVSREGKSAYGSHPSITIHVAVTACSQSWATRRTMLALAPGVGPEMLTALGVVGQGGKMKGVRK